MFAEGLTTPLMDRLARPDFAAIAPDLTVRFDPMLGARFRASADAIVVGPQIDGVALRHAIELSALLQGRGPEAHAVAILLSARVAAVFHALEPENTRQPLPAWLTPFAGKAPEAATLAYSWPKLAELLEEPVQPPDFAQACAQLAELWTIAGPAEWLMAQGGDNRLHVDPVTGLNRYGCSHRPRPWAITFASTTASSVSERGFAGADAARRQFLGTVLDAWVTGSAIGPAIQAGITALLVQVRERLAAFYGLEASAQVMLCPSGTDAELAALALVAARTGQPICNIVIAPDETGSGVPLAARGRHFAPETAHGVAVEPGTLVAGFPVLTMLVGVPLRAEDGTRLSRAAVDAACAAEVWQARAQGWHVLLHILDQSKTGLVGPSPDQIALLRDACGKRLDVVIDACQARLMPDRLGRAVVEGAMAMVTGSKFLTGPPFCGALLLPPAMAAAMPDLPMPSGLSDYLDPHEWPGAADTGRYGNLGLALRWHASLAEGEALIAQPDIAGVLAHFLDALRTHIREHAHLVLLEVPPFNRAASGAGQDWDDLPTIVSFLVLGQDDAPLSLEATRAIYRWLNADLSALVPARFQTCARRLCHIGQPVPVAHPECTTPDGKKGGIAGALRMSAGARLVSGEPSHAGIGERARIAREIADAGLVLEKIALIVQNWDTIAHADPKPSYD